jgi:deoxyribodipyrimidine photo-lyase
MNIFWFRRDLRLHDNAGLFHALRNGEPVMPIFIFDSEILSLLDNKKDKRVSFIYDALRTIDTELRKYNASMHIFYGKPNEVIQDIVAKYEVRGVYANHDYEPKAIKRDETISVLLQKKNINFYTYKDQVIFEKSEVMKGDGTPYTIFTPYSRVWKAKLTEENYKSFPSEDFLDHYYKSNVDFFQIEKFGFEYEPSLPIVPPTLNMEVIQDYHYTRNLPAIVGTSGLSTYMRFGLVSTRELVKIAQNTNDQWLNELIWREFFMMILFHFPKVENNCFKQKYENIQWRNDELEFEKWCKGNTGYPIVDAGMRELNSTGLMHNRVRMVVACFLTKHLLIDWRWGEAYFAEKLMDYDLSANNGNWQWSAGCGCDSAPYFRVFNPAEQTRKFDPEMKYIRKWVPEVDEFYYPKPMVEHSFARDRALKVYKEGLETTNM